MVVFAAVSAVFTMANAWYAVGFSEHTAHVVRLYLYKKIQTFSFGNFDRFPTSNLLGMMVSDVNAIKEAVLQVVTSLVQAPVMGAGGDRPGLPQHPQPGLDFVDCPGPDADCPGGVHQQNEPPV